MSTFAETLLRWYEQHGRYDLPWQQDRSLYSTWVSEIMLQQTQVATVIPYFERFMQRFPDSQRLAQASVDEVLLHWAGLGYYSRARNLHRAALIITEKHQSQFPQDYESVLALPGIGPSTAGAILAQALGQRHTILDGNVKRVLARYNAIEGWPGLASVEKQLWHRAETYTPTRKIAEYTQAIMDLGATVCTRAATKCDLCPLTATCQAYLQARVAELPVKRPKKVLPIREKRLLIIRNDQGAYLMEKRPPAGIWGGLWSLPELPMDRAVDVAVRETWRLTVKKHCDLPVLRHTFSHFHLDITPCQVQVEAMSPMVKDQGMYQWWEDTSGLAMASPVSSILQTAK